MSRLCKNIGPGFLLAGAAIGVSHLVQATRAGAEYGWVLIIALVIACISKYPFLYMGPRYTAATGKNLVEGYKALGKFQYYSYIFISIATMFIALAAITLVTAGIAAFLLPFEFSLVTWSIIILGLCVATLSLGRYHTLDNAMKIIISLLALLTFFAVIIAAVFIESNNYIVETPTLTTTSSIIFIVAFMGWMPIPIDAAVWHSIWTKEKSKSSGKQTTLKDVFWDFNIGYIGASVIALLFFALGVLIMFGSGIEFSDSSIAFSSQLIDLYAQTLGEWTKSIIGLAALITMFSTTLTIVDAYPRVISEIFYLEKGFIKQKTYFISMLILYVVALLIITFSLSQFKLLVDFAAGVSFLAAPFLAWFNYQLFQQKDIEKSFKLKTKFKVFSLCCLGGLIIFDMVYLWSIFYM